MPVLPSWGTHRVYGSWGSLVNPGQLLPGTVSAILPVDVHNVPQDIIIPKGRHINAQALNTTAGLPSLDIEVPASDDPDNLPTDFYIEIVVQLTEPRVTYTYKIPTPLGGETNLRTILDPTSVTVDGPLFVGVAGGLARLSDDGTTVLNADGDPISAGSGGAGPDGASAYEVAVADGFVGDETAWLASLVGPQGEPGQDGADGAPGADGSPGADGQDGAPGVDGVDGKSAYDLARDQGYGGTQTQWLASLKGDKGDKGDPGNDGAPGQDGAPGVDGQDGVPGADGEDGAEGPQGPPGDPTQVADGAIPQAKVTNLTTDLAAKADAGPAGLVTGVPMQVVWSGSAWPTRPTARTDTPVWWVTNDPSAPNPPGFVEAVDLLLVVDEAA